LTNACPKPLLPLGDRAILSHILDRIPAELPVTVLVTDEVAPAFEAWKKTLSSTRDVRLYVEQPRRTGLNGPVVALADCIRDSAIDDDLVIFMGDSVSPFRLEEFLTGDPSALRLAAIRLPDLRDASRFGVLEISDADTVLGFEEKPAAPRSPWIFTGCLRVPRAQLGVLTEVGEGSLPQMGHLVERYLELGQAIEVFRVEGAWQDIGTFSAYLEAHRALAPGAVLQSLAALGNQLSGVVYVHPGAHVAGSTLTNCIVGEGARVENAQLTNCVIHPRVHVTGRVVQDSLLSLEAELALG
jgi:NDP-sugar pyrophosphorylase family protein